MLDEKLKNAGKTMTMIAFYIISGMGLLSFLIDAIAKTSFLDTFKKWVGMPYGQVFIIVFGTVFAGKVVAKFKDSGDTNTTQQPQNNGVNTVSKKGPLTMNKISNVGNTASNENTFIIGTDTPQEIQRKGAI